MKQADGEKAFLFGNYFNSFCVPNSIPAIHSQLDFIAFHYLRRKRGSILAMK